MHVRIFILYESKCDYATFKRPNETTLRSYTLFFNRITNYNNQCFKIHFKGKSAFQLLKSSDSYHNLCDNGFTQNRCI